MDKIDKMTVDQMMADWYRYASEQPGSVDSLLLLLRNRSGQTLEQQQAEFGASDYEFNRLRGFRLPRPHVFTSDAHRIAMTCKLAKPFAFVNSLVLARNLARSLPKTEVFQYYQAAFDERDDLDQLPDGSK